MATLPLSVADSLDLLDYVARPKSEGASIVWGGCAGDDVTANYGGDPGFGVYLILNRSTSAPWLERQSRGRSLPRLRKAPWCAKPKRLGSATRAKRATLRSEERARVDTAN